MPFVNSDIPFFAPTNTINSLARPSFSLSDMLHRYPATIIFILAALIYANTIPNGWTIDDGIVIHQNHSVQRGLGGLPAIFGSDLQKSSTDQDIKSIAGGRYRPLTPAVFAVFSEVRGRLAEGGQGLRRTDNEGHALNDLGEKTVFPHLLHLFNVLLYALTCTVLFQLLQLLLKNYERCFFIALTAALLFTVHPLHTEAVANVKGADEIAALLFCLLSTRLFVRAADLPGRRWMNIALGSTCLFLAMLAKENAATFLAVIPLTLWAFRNVRARKLAATSMLLLIPAVLYLAMRLNAVGSLSLAPPDSLNMMNNPFLVVQEGEQFAPLLPGSEVSVLQQPSVQSIVPMPYTQKLATVLATWLQYGKLFIIPHPLTYDYYPRHIAVHSFADPAVWISALLHLGGLIWAVKNFRRKSLAAYGILFYLITFSIVSNLLFPVGTNMAERFMFMPSVGLCIFTAAGLSATMRRRQVRTLAPGIAVIAIVFSIRTIVRNNDWRDNLTLMQHDLQVSGNSAKIKSDYGEAVLNKTDDAARQAGADEIVENIGLLKSTLPLYKEALDVYPMYGLVWFNLARTHQRIGGYETLSPNERLTHLLTAVAAYRLTDTYRPLRYLHEVDTEKSMCYASLGKLYGQQFGDPEKAIACLRLARAINARNAYADFLLGTAFDLKGMTDSSCYYTALAYEAEPANRDYMENYAQAVQKQVASGRQDKSRLKVAEEILLRVNNRNESLPLSDSRRAAFIVHTKQLLQQNYLLRDAGEPIQDSLSGPVNKHQAH